jgi:hypothetical protein
MESCRWSYRPSLLHYILLSNKLVISLKIVEDLGKSFSFFLYLILYRLINKLSYLSLASLKRLYRCNVLVT